ncbi:2-phospho-L-lactate guanylyltransferase [Halovivax limisalsi]|uniref:2-phospho-L-lactate guanylyltransferase n=1 Tax=Halovivax limisalsi TaxID=1453760 RepID=UPI001FFDB831|nr:2-phospho-L-lactate guanylyltransferase [Halovivax limisalsi]
MEVLIPFAADAPKSRLSPVLSPDERRAFARAMLADVLGAIEASGRDPRVLATAPIDVDATVTVDERPLSEAVNARLDEHFGSPAPRRSVSADPLAVVMADLALATPSSLDRLFDASADVALAPGRGGGTNAFLTRHPDFRVDYHGTSYLDHRRIASEIDASVAVVDSVRLSTDVDEPADLVEVLCHGDGRARDYLDDAGFELETTDGRVTVSRPGR